MRFYLTIDGGAAGIPTCIGCPMNIEIATRIATSTIKHLTTIRMFAGITVSKSTTYQRMIAAIAISEIATTIGMKFIEAPFGVAAAEVGAGAYHKQGAGGAPAQSPPG